MPVPAPVTGESPPGILILRNMVDLDGCDDELESEVHGECSNYGPVDRVIIHQEIDPETNTGCVKVFVQFVDQQSVGLAIEALHGRFFAGRQITAEPYDIQAFLMNDYSL
ncbi:putative fuse-binding protein-interacting repressor siahbp1 [Fasciola hepatica]|uniref:Fuse-binding protein-interacting repressor siahbp1 n=1 Tax=Fasciola hepatica TaxID=6192 RepID=A0A2H1BTV1_FASHE|nr:putative fuse-binding protein-interacting repressor siahbp1 [Fasciola hepatica]